MTRCNDQMIGRTSIAFQFIVIYIHAEGRSASLNSQPQLPCALKLYKNERNKTKETKEQQGFARKDVTLVIPVNYYIYKEKAN